MNKSIKAIIIGLSILLFPFSGYAQYSLNKEINGATLTVKPKGRLAIDGAFFKEDNTQLSNGVSFTEARIGLSASYKSWSTTIDFGFTENKISPKDIFLQYTINSRSEIIAGHKAEPFGLDAMEGAQNLRFFTGSSATNAFAPGRKVGIAYVYHSSYFWGSAGFFGDGNGMGNRTEGDDGYAATSRVVFNPFQQEGSIFHIGLAGSYRKADANGINEEENKENSRIIRYSSPLLSHIKKKDFISATITDANYQAKYAIELIGALGPISFQGEYFHSYVKRRNELTSYQANGIYGQISYLLLGGKQSYSSNVARLGQLKPKDLELVIRYDYTDLDCEEANIFGGKMSDWSVALNYQLNKYISFKMNYSHIKLGNRSPLAGGEKINVIQGRVLVLF